MTAIAGRDTTESTRIPMPYPATTSIGVTVFPAPRISAMNVTNPNRNTSPSEMSRM